VALDPITAILNVGNTLIERLIPDKNAQNQAKLAMLQMQAQGELAQLAGQLDVNKAEASNPNWFVAGWRPAVGWTCAAGLVSQFLISPFATWLASLLGHPINYPSLDMGTLLTLLMGMLGLGGLRTYEKTQDVVGKH
jgi:hypothetical protein